MRGADPRLVDGPRGLTGARLLAVLAAGCLVGLVFGSRPLAAWAGRLPAGWEPVQAAAGWWDGVMGNAGLAAPYDAVHRTVREWSGG